MLQHPAHRFPHWWAQVAAVSSSRRGHRPLYGHRIEPVLSRTFGPEGLISTPHLPSAFVAATSLRPGFLLISLATREMPEPPSSNTPVVVRPQFGGRFQPRHGGGISTLCRFGADTQEPALLFLVNGTKTLPQMVNSSPKSSALVKAHGSLYGFGRLAQTILPAGTTRLVAKIISSGQSLCFIWPEKAFYFVKEPQSW